MTFFHDFKIYLVAHTGLAKDALHIYVAVIIFFAACLIMRWKARDWRPWALVLLAALSGEVLDLLDSYFRGRELDLRESAKDIVNTLMVPTIIVITARFTKIFRKG